MSKPRVALFGLGIMGSGMARRLLGADFPLVVYNRTGEKAAPLAAEGAQVAASPREAAAQSEVLISMVADDAAGTIEYKRSRTATTEIDEGPDASGQPPKSPPRPKP